MSSWSKRVLMNVPSPNPERSALSRFIPREELGEFANWSPGSFGSPQAAEKAPASPPAAPPGPSAAEWQARVDAARQTGYQEGYRDGMVALDGFKKSHAEQVGTQMAAFVRSLDHEFDALHEKLAGAVAQVLVQLARQVLHAELATSPELVAQVAAGAVEAVLRSARHITVQVHAQDLPLVAAGAAEVLAARGARLVVHPAIQRGGCRVESDMGSIDAQIATRWAQAAGAMGSELPWDASAEVEAIE